MIHSIGNRPENYEGRFFEYKEPGGGIMSSHVIIWLIIIVVFIVAEILTTQLVGIWFVPGAIIALIFAAINAKFWIQVLVFAVVTAVLLVMARPFVKRYLGSRITPTNADRAIGQTALVVEDIGNGFIGQVKVNGMVWSAVNENDELITKGDRVTVKAIDGVKLIVEKILKEEEA